MKLRNLPLLLLCAFLPVVTAHAETVNVAAASDLSFALKEIIPQFEHETGNQVHLTLGSSGNFYAQIMNGAPFDVFLSADVDYPRQLEQRGSAISGSTFVYGIGRIAVWTRNESHIEVDRLGLRALLDPSIRKIAIANPAHAPYGRAAVSALEKEKVYDSVKGKLVLGENVSQAAQFVQSGAADVGIVALSIASSAPMREKGKYWIVPADMYPPLRQGAVLLKRAGPAGKAFHEWLHLPQAQQILKKYGFGR
jgi:molybdate transport system substrate-binding protein